MTATGDLYRDVSYYLNCDDTVLTIISLYRTVKSKRLIITYNSSRIRDRPVELSWLELAGDILFPHRRTKPCRDVLDEGVVALNVASFDLFVFSSD